MNKIAVSVLSFASIASFAFAGTDYSGKEVRQTAAPQECFYGDTEWNVSLWGAYAFTSTDNNRTGIEETDDLNIFGHYDRFLGGAPPWGGRRGAKYFFRRYFSVGLEGLALAGRGAHGVPG